MPRRVRLNSFLGLLLSAIAMPAGMAGAAEPAPPEAVLLGETRFPAELAAVDRQWRISFRTDDNVRTVVASELVRWAAPCELSNQPYLLLVDGSVLAAHVLASDETKLNVESDWFGSLAIPLELIGGVLYHPPIDMRRRDRMLDELREPGGRNGAESSAADDEQPRNSDLLILENGDRLAGTITGIDETKAALETQTGPVSVEMERIVAIRFNPSLLSPIRPRGFRCLVGFSDGSLLTVSELIADERETELSLSCALELKTEAGAVRFLQPLGGAAVYLSDLTSESYRHVPYLTLAWPYALDASVSGSRLRAGGRLYVKGIGMHSASRLTYRLDKPYRRFETELAVDDETAGRGSVVFRIFVDNREAYRSPVIRGRMPPVPVSVDVRNGKRLSLIVDFAERGDELDHADWLDARLVK